MMQTDTERKIDNLRTADRTRQPINETMLCACGFQGPPRVILEMEDDYFVCPKCGDY